MKHLHIYYTNTHKHTPPRTDLLTFLVTKQEVQEREREREIISIMKMEISGYKLQNVDVDFELTVNIDS